MKNIELFSRPLAVTPIMPLSGNYTDNELYMKRDDMIPFSFGGNKARKAAEFYKEIIKSGADVVMTYGSNSSNHCRIIANMAAAMGLSCHIISPEENREILYNTKMVEQFGAVIETCPVTMVSETIEKRIKAYKNNGKKPYFITGGGHGNPGTESYVKAYNEILRQEEKDGIFYDYIFHASGTGTTQAGLICGKLLAGDVDRTIVGISIARKEEIGRAVVRDSIKEYLGEDFEKLYTENTLIFTDSYCCGGYGNYTSEIENTIDYVMKREGIPMDTTYVGKAFHGMLRYIDEEHIVGKKILFIHTGGTPLFFDYIKNSEN
ncbi:MAG: pyridoxal-phosphate dependent enzyme [Lachnospiraceae bacterium]|nr:pyridoxal-phosphate dependent enzyme [Lachnospiraceae bacterium]